MGHVSKAIDRLPPWAKMIPAVLTVAASVWYIARYGLLTYILTVIFSPDL